MSKVLNILIVIGAIFICIITIMILWVKPANWFDTRLNKQENLAKELEVNIEDYPYRKSFPVGYFYSILQQGMTVDDVHKIIQGYEEVLHCGNTAEIYYYFSSELENAKRFMIVYDGEGKFVRLEGEEDDSRTIQTFGCQPGQIIP